MDPLKDITVENNMVLLPDTDKVSIVELTKVIYGDYRRTIWYFNEEKKLSILLTLTLGIPLCEGLYLK